MTNLQVGDTVIRKTERNKAQPTTGTITRIYTRHSYNRRNGQTMAEVRWQGANRTRLGATTPDKVGRISLDALMAAEQVQP